MVKASCECPRISITTRCWHILRQQEGRAGMPQVVEANAAHACFGDEFIEEAVQMPARAERRSYDQSPSLTVGLAPQPSKIAGILVI